MRNDSRPSGDRQALDGSARLAALQQAVLMDSPPEQAFDRLTRLAVRLLHAPIALVALVDQQGQVAKSYPDMPDPCWSEQEAMLTNRLCQYTATTRRALLIKDARTHPLGQEYLASTDSDSIAYAGVPLMSPEGHALGTFCVIDHQPRNWTAEEVEMLEDLGASVVTEIELRAAMQEATSHASQLEATFDAITDAAFIYDKDGSIIRANAAARELLGIDQADFYKLPLLERLRSFHIWNEQDQPISAEHPPSLRILRGETLKGATAVEGSFQRPDGRRVFFNSSGAPVYDPAGHITGGIVLIRDVSERRRLEQRTQETLNALLAMAQSLVFERPDTEPVDMQKPSDTLRIAQRLIELTCSVLGCQRVSMSVIDPETEIIRPVAVVGLSPEQERQWWAEQPTDARLSDSPMPNLLARFLRGEVLILDMRQPPFNEQPNPYGVTTMLVAPMRAGEQIVGMITLDYGGAEHDYPPQEIALAGGVAKLAALVIERERLLREREAALAREFALREANERMDAFMGIASHELKTPLTSIKASIQLAQRRLKGLAASTVLSADELNTFIEAFRQLLDRSARQLGLLNRLVDDLLDVSRIQAGKLEMHQELTNLGAIVRDAIQEQAELTPRRIIRLQAAADAPVMIYADADRIGQVVTNYLTNALKYSPEDCAVEVGLDVEGRQVRVWVRDQGPGMPPEEQERIWERFHRVRGIEIQSGSGVGLGLGLYISKTIIERHHGQVGVQSTPGEGSTFWFTLPLDNAPGTSV
jgi:PAS domain S-box-containing protein